MTTTNSKETFLPGINKRYLGSLAGLIHATCSVTALLIGNYLFLQSVVLGNDILASSEDDGSSLLPLIFHVSTAFSGIMLFFFWKSVQSYQHSTTSIKDKGLTPKQMQNVNRARGCFALIICAVYPLMYRYLSDKTLKDTGLCRIVAVYMVAINLYMYSIFKAYGSGLFILYAGTRFGFSIQVLFTGSLYSVRESYPHIVNFFEKEALLISCCVEFGFLLYYLESRKFISVQNVRDACKRYHPVMFFIYVGRMVVDKFWGRVPVSVSWATFLEAVLASLFLKKMITGVFKTLRSKKEEITDKREAFGKSKRDKSLFDVTSNSGRRSSIFESIDVGVLFTIKEE